MDRLNMVVDPILAQFQRDGFAVVPDLADAATVAELKRVYDGMIDGSVACHGTDRMLGGITRQIMSPHLHHPHFRENTALEKARAIAGRLMGCEAPPFFFSMLIDKPPHHPHETPWHQDMSYAGKPVLPAGSVLDNHAVTQFWLALADVDEAMGCMEFIPGAQDRPMPEHIVAAGDPDHDSRLLAAKDPAAAWALGQAVKCPLRRGSATVHGYSTPHFTGPNTTDRSRPAYIFSFARPDVFAAAMAQQDAAH